MEKEITLMEYESNSYMLVMPAISTLTFYRGHAPVAALTDKVNAIIGANIWLQGKLEGKENNVTLKYSTVPTKYAVKTVTISDLKPNMDLELLKTNVKEHLVKTAQDCLNKNEELFKVTVATISEDEFALIVSFSHALGDGHSYYDLYGMLSNNSTIKSLEIQRVPRFFERLEDVIPNKNDSWHWLFSLGMVINYMLSMWFPKSTKHNMFLLNSSAFEQKKKEYIVYKDNIVTTTDDNKLPDTSSTNSIINNNTHSSSLLPQFISTNDILTAELFKQSQCHIGFMAMNFRNRIVEITNNHVGNYEALLGYQQEDFQESYQIRQSLINNHRAKSGLFPSFFQTLGIKLSFLTSWVTFYCEVELEGCTQYFHMPYTEKNSGPFEFSGIVFRCNKDQLGLITVGTDAAIESVAKSDIVEKLYV